MIQFVRGDLLASLPYFDGIAHGVNCQGVMGAGIAVGVRACFPHTYALYREACRDGALAPGGMLYVAESEVDVYNCASQDGFGDARLDWLEESLTRVRSYIRSVGGPAYRLGLPMIGSGLGGLRPRPVKRTLIEVFGDEAFDTVVFEHYEPGLVWVPEEGR